MALLDSDLAVFGHGARITSQTVVTTANQNAFAQSAGDEFGDACYFEASTLGPKYPGPPALENGKYIPAVDTIVVQGVDGGGSPLLFWYVPTSDRAYAFKPDCATYPQMVTKARGSAQFIVSGTGEGGGGWVLLLAGAALVYLMLKGK